MAIEATPTFFGSLGELEELASAVLFKRHPLGAGTVASESRGSLCSDASNVPPGSRRRARRDPPTSANIEGVVPAALPSGDWRGRQQGSAIGTIDRAQWRASTFADRRQAGGLAKERAPHSLADCARRRPCSAHSGLRGSSAARAVEMRAKTRTQIRFGPLALGGLTPCNRFLSTCPRAHSSNIQLRPILRFIIGLVFATAALASPGFAQPTDDSLRLYAVDIWQDPPQSWGPGRGVYLGKGLIITAAHVVSPVARTKPSVRIAGMDLPATAIREGNFERVDLTLLSIDEQKLPIYLQMRRMPLCDNEPWPGEPVIVAIPEGAARSHIMLPSLLPAQYQKRFSTVIRDVATTGKFRVGRFRRWPEMLARHHKPENLPNPEQQSPRKRAQGYCQIFRPGIDHPGLHTT